MADDKTPKSPELEAAELRKTIAEARKAELEAKREAMSLEQDRVYWERKRRQHAEEDAYDNDRHRVVYLNTSVSGGSVEKVRNKLQTWRREEPGCDIEIILNSPGGSVFDGLDLGDLIEEMVDDGHQITTRIAGIAASMAGVLAQFGSRRLTHVDERPGREELIEALRHACIAAKRVRGTVHYDKAHAHIDRLLDELVGL